MSLMVSGMSPCTPIIILFLTIERIIYITWPLTKLKYLARITVVLTIVCFISNVIAIYLDSLPRQKEECNDCESKKTRGALYNITKMGFGLMNLIAGAVFLLKLHQTRSMVEPLQPAQSTTKRINKIAVLVICLELFLNFLPQLTAFILEQTFGITLGSIVGVYNFIGCAIDIFISSVTYTTIFHRRNQANNSNWNEQNEIHDSFFNKSTNSIQLRYK
ncbi:hypothetical protein DdX_17257 [Ditylenchus destructor]|uniref:G-protein coupled receptors family 1 profile domain-containing protein n=1 Tax=Ditylenchus destructor TaxID=166010 RepID=A0AAD4MN48_9BILA|nr:hypothetical protein DdX_17257 [Ditylenchus destructor]